MKFSSLVGGLSLLTFVSAWNPVSDLSKRWGILGAPKVVIISMFGPEAGIWYGPDKPWNLYTHNITVPGFSPIYPMLHCSKGYEVCQITIGEG
jgi:purine nucleoside permease